MYVDSCYPAFCRLGAEMKNKMSLLVQLILDSVTSPCTHVFILGPICLIFVSNNFEMDD